jgi:hypothetical protein
MQTNENIYSSDEMETNFATKHQHAIEQINALNDDLKFVCNPHLMNMSSTAAAAAVSPDASPTTHGPNALLTLNSTFTNQTMSLFTEDRLYPQFNYLVELAPIRHAIEKLAVQINTDAANCERQRIVDEQHRLVCETGLRMHCFGVSGIGPDGSFWLHCTGPAAHIQDENNNSGGMSDDVRIYYASKAKVQYVQFLEEMSRAVRRRRIADRGFRTYAELGEDYTPALRVNDLCFCLEPRTQRWQRARVLDFEKKNVISETTGEVVVNFLKIYFHCNEW